MGQTKTERYTITKPDSPASKAQRYAVYSITGVDIQQVKLTMGQASGLIDLANSGKSRHVRLKVSSLAGAVVKTQDVNRKLRSHPKPRGYSAIVLPALKTATAKVTKRAKAVPKALSAVEQLTALIAANPELKSLLTAPAVEVKAAKVTKKPVKKSPAKVLPVKPAVVEDDISDEVALALEDLMGM